MLSFLNNPYPIHVGMKEALYNSIGVGIFVGLFLVIYSPFEVYRPEIPYMGLKVFGYGFVSFICVFLFHYVIPVLFSNWYTEKNHTVGRELFLNSMLIFTISVVNIIYSFLVYPKAGLYRLLPIFWNTFLVGIFPLTFFVLVDYSKKLNQNLKESAAIKVPDAESTESMVVAENIPTAVMMQLEIDQETIEIHPDTFLYVESDGNYATLVQFKAGKLEKKIFRTTLKAIEAQIKSPDIRRCHRSYIVNLKKVKSVSGNAQGFKLSLHDTDEIVSVSRKYVPEIKAFFK